MYPTRVRANCWQPRGTIYRQLPPIYTSRRRGNRARRLVYDPPPRSRPNMWTTVGSGLLALAVVGSVLATAVAMVLIVLPDLANLPL